MDVSTKFDTSETSLIMVQFWPPTIFIPILNLPLAWSNAMEMLNDQYRFSSPKIRVLHLHTKSTEEQNTRRARNSLDNVISCKSDEAFLRLEHFRIETIMTSKTENRHPRPAR